MALTDPQSVTINAITTPLPRVSTGVNQSKYVSNDGLVSLTASHAYGRTTRRLVRLDHSKIAPDPMISDRNIKHSMSAHLVIQVPVTGYTVTEAKQIVDGLLATLTASSGALITKVLGGEN